MDIAGQGGQVIDLPHMRLAVENGLIQVRNRPPLGYIERKCLRQLFSRRTGNRIAPGPEFRQLVALRVKGQIAVHHGRNTDAGHLFECHAIFFAYIPDQIGIGILNALPDITEMIGPDAVLKPVFPGVAAARDRLMLFINQNRLDSRRTKFDSQNAVSCFNDSFCFLIHLVSPPSDFFAGEGKHYR